MAYVSAENRLAVSDIYANCGQEPMMTRARGPCAMGVDVGTDLHVVVGARPREGVLQIIYLARVKSFGDVHDIARRFNVQAAVLDLEPETRKAREFQAGEEYPVFLCDYVNSSSGIQGIKWDEEKKQVKVRRTEICDAVHDLFAREGAIILPRRNEEVEEYARELCNIAKVLEEDPETGSREYRYRKLGPDHYYHATAYFYLASKKIWLAEGFFETRSLPTHYRTDVDVFAPNYGANACNLHEPVRMSEWSPFD
jgi:hypothetical protein